MMSEWPMMSLYEAGVQLFDCEHRTPAPTETGFPYIAIPQIKEGRLDLTNVRYISHDDFVDWTKKTCPQPWDVILSRRCNPGETAYVPPHLKCALGQNLVILRSNGSKVIPEFLRWLIRGPYWKEQVQTYINVGAVFDSLKCQDIPNFRLPIPPLPEQRAIAHILGTLDDKIELNRRMNETLESMARAIFKSWFVDFDPVRAKAEGRDTGLPEEIADLFPDSFEETELGEVSKGWKISKLSNVCEYIMSGGTPSTQIPAYWDGDIPWMSSGETRNRFITKTEKTITNLGVEKSSTRLARSKSTVIASAGQGHTRGQTSLLLFDSYINQSVVALAADSKQVSDYYLFFNLSGRYEELRQISDSHSSRGSLTTKLLNNLDIIIPSLELVSKFSQFTEAVVGKIQQNLLQSSMLTELRDTLLPKLISGELRVKNAEHAI